MCGCIYVHSVNQNKLEFDISVYKYKNEWVQVYIDKPTDQQQTSWTKRWRNRKKHLRLSKDPVTVSMINQFHNWFPSSVESEADLLRHSKQTASQCHCDTLEGIWTPMVAQMVEHGASNAKIMGSIPRESKSW